MPRAFTLDIETLALPGFRDRVGPKLERDYRLGYMRLEQQQRYLEDIAAEEERVYQLGSLNAISGRILSIAVHIGPVPGIEIPGLTSNQSEQAFGIDADGNLQEEAEALKGFLMLMSDFDPDCDLVVGHNIISFDLPFIFQRCFATISRSSHLSTSANSTCVALTTRCARGGSVIDAVVLAWMILRGR